MTAASVIGFLGLFVPLLGNWLATRKTGQNSRWLALLQLAPEAWQATEHWAQGEKVRPLADAKLAHFFVELGGILYQRGMGSMNLAESKVLETWASMRSRGAKAAEDAGRTALRKLGIAI